MKIKSLFSILLLVVLSFGPCSSIMAMSHSDAINADELMQSTDIRDVEQSVSIYGQLVSSNPDDGMWHAGLAEAMARRYKLSKDADHRTAARFQFATAEKYLQTKDALLERAKGIFALGDFDMDQARIHFSAAVKGDPFDGYSIEMLDLLESGALPWMFDDPLPNSGNGSPGNSNTISSKTTTLSPIADAGVYAYSYRNWDKANLGAYTQFRAGWNPAGGETRTYIKFNLSAVDPAWNGKAILKLYHHAVAGSSGLDLGIYRVTSRWLEGNDTYHSGRVEKIAAPGELSWLQQPSIDNQAITTFNPGHIQQDWVSVDITRLVKKWLAGTANHGLVIKTEGSLSYNIRASVYRFASKEATGQDKGPQLELYSPGADTEPASNDFSPGNVWIVKEYDNSVWDGVWTRRGGTNLFDARWRNNMTGQIVEDVIEYIGVKGSKVTLYRQGIQGTYTGTISGDGKSIEKGTATWYRSRVYWEAEIR